MLLVQEELQWFSTLGPEARAAWHGHLAPSGFGMALADRIFSIFGGLAGVTWLAICAQI